MLPQWQDYGRFWLEWTELARRLVVELNNAMASEDITQRTGRAFETNLRQLSPDKRHVPRNRDKYTWLIDEFAG